MFIGTGLDLVLAGAGHYVLAKAGTAQFVLGKDSGGLNDFRGGWLCLDRGPVTWHPPVLTGSRESSSPHGYGGPAAAALCGDLGMAHQQAGSSFPRDDIPLRVAFLRRRPTSRRRPAYRQGAVRVQATSDGSASRRDRKSGPATGACRRSCPRALNCHVEDPTEHRLDLFRAGIAQPFHDATTCFWRFHVRSGSLPDRGIGSHRQDGAWLGQPSHRPLHRYGQNLRTMECAADDQLSKHLGHVRRLPKRDLRNCAGWDASCSDEQARLDRVVR